eukprot:3626876-Pyramimonas_sp.AAC.1
MPSAPRARGRGGGEGRFGAAASAQGPRGAAGLAIATGAPPRGPPPLGGPRVLREGPSSGGPPLAGDEHFKGAQATARRQMWSAPSTS